MKQTEYKLINGETSYIIEADKGKVFVHVNDNTRHGNKISLGYRFRDKDGKVLAKPYLEKPEDYVEDNMTDEEKKMEEAAI